MNVRKTGGSRYGATVRMAPMLAGPCFQSSADRERIAGRAGGVEHAHGMLVERIAGRREPHRAAEPFEEGRAELVFELDDLLTERRLRDEAPLGGRGETEQLCDGGEVTKLSSSMELRGGRRRGERRTG